MPSLSCKDFLWAAFIFPIVILTNLSTIAVAKNNNYVVVGPYPACSIIVGKLDVRSFQMLLPASQISTLVTNNSIVNIHVCECLLMGGDQQKCAIAAISKNVLLVPITRTQQAQLAGRIFIRVDDPSDFANLYATLTTLYPQASLPAAEILHRAVKESPIVGGGAVGGGGRTLPPTEPPNPPPLPLSTAPAAHEDEKKRCELEPNVCINPASGEPSAEFELKCKGFPTIVFSTDIKAGFKVGPVEVSFSPKGEKEQPTEQSPD